MAYRMSVDVDSARLLDGVLLRAKSFKLVNLDFTACLGIGCYSSVRHGPSFC
jgi:hypothetical protein